LLLAALLVSFVARVIWRDAARCSLGIDLLEERLNLCERDADRAGHPVKSNLTKKNYRAKQSGVTSKWEMSATEITGDDIKGWRARKALTQAMAARRLGLAKATLQDWERGRRMPGITRGVGPEQFRRVVRTIFHT